MRTNPAYTSRRLLAGAILAAMSGCANQPAAGSAPPPAAYPYADLSGLRVNNSTSDDVRRLLGEPNGDGALLLPGATQSDTWFYETVRYSIKGSTFNVYQDVIMVFFADDRVSGYLWYSNTVPAE